MTKASSIVPEMPDGKYQGSKVIDTLRSLKKRDNKRHLTMAEKTELDNIANIFQLNGFINKAQYKTIWKLFYNYVHMDYRRV